MKLRVENNCCWLQVVHLVWQGTLFHHLAWWALLLGGNSRVPGQTRKCTISYSSHISRGSPSYVRRTKGSDKWKQVVQGMCRYEFLRVEDEGAGNAEYKTWPMEEKWRFYSLNSKLNLTGPLVSYFSFIPEHGLWHAIFRFSLRNLFCQQADSNSCAEAFFCFSRTSRGHYFSLVFKVTQNCFSVFLLFKEDELKKKK